jgi:hypothetical protein
LTWGYRLKWDVKIVDYLSSCQFNDMRTNAICCCNLEQTSWFRL